MLPVDDEPVVPVVVEVEDELVEGSVDSIEPLVPPVDVEVVVVVL